MRTLFTLSFVLLFTAAIFAQQGDFGLSANNNPNEPGQNTLTEKTEKEKDFTFTVNPYLWLVNTSGTVGIPGVPPTDFKLSFSDAVSNMDFAFMVLGRFRYKPVSLLYDISYVELGPEAITEVQGITVTNTSKMKQFVGDFALAYTFPMKNKTIQLDGYAGTRVWSIDNSMNVTESTGQGFSASHSKTWADPIIGAGINYGFSKNWFVYFKGDAGGFGVSSDFTTALLGGVGYNFAKHWNTTLAIKALYLNYNVDNYVYDLWQYGPGLSIGYKFF